MTYHSARSARRHSFCLAVVRDAVPYAIAHISITMVAILGLKVNRGQNKHHNFIAP